MNPTDEKRKLHVLPGAVKMKIDQNEGLYYMMPRTVTRLVPVYITIEFDGRKLSIHGVTDPRSNGEADGSCGQNIDDLRASSDHPNVNQGWTTGMIYKLAGAWDAWHMNDMRPWCEHQRLNWEFQKTVEVVEYRLTTEAARLRDRVRQLAADHALEGRKFPKQEPMIEALGLLKDPYLPRYSPPDADDPLSGCYEVRKREMKQIGWVYPQEHPEGILMKPCEECGYKYGSAWNFEEVPEETIEWLFSLPEADPPMPTTWRR